MKPLVLYHANCMDGFCAAWLLWMCRWRDEAEYVPMQYGAKPAEIPEVEGREVFIVDFSFPRERMLEMRRAANSLIVLDHHKTAAKDMKGFDWCIFDMAKCGARLTWEWLRNHGMNKMRLVVEPWFLQYIEDRDLWTHKLKDTHAINAALRNKPRSFLAWEAMAQNRDFAPLIVEGNALLAYKAAAIKACVETACEVEIGGEKVLAANCSVGDFTSEVCKELADGRVFGASYMDVGDKRVWSLRSDAGGYDVSEIARKYGGGGHERAAGFTVMGGVCSPPIPKAAKQAVAK